MDGTRPTPPQMLYVAAPGTPLVVGVRLLADVDGCDGKPGRCSR